MKRNILHIIGALAVALTFAACERVEPDFFDKNANGAYFDYEYAADFEKVLNFSEHIVGAPDTVTVTLNVKLLGYLMDKERTLAVKTKEVEGYELADVTIDEVVFANREYEKEIAVRVKRPQVEDVTCAVCIYLDGSGDIGTGINGKNEINLFVTESYEKPAVWYSHVDTYLGTWSKEKHIFLAEHTGNNRFYSNLYDESSSMHIFDSIINLNVSAVNALLATAPVEPIEVDLPILAETDYPSYTEPYFWSEYEPYLGVFRANKFCRFTTMLGGSGTRNVAALFASEEGAAKMQEEADNFHKNDVFTMLNEYYSYAMMGYPISEYKNLFWVEIRNNVNYTVRIPFWWEDPNSLGTAAIAKKYFGEYSDDKYQFMLKTMAKEDGEENFIAASILPFAYDSANGTFCWDSSKLGKNGLSGEERLKECYRVIKAANDKRPASRRFDIPDVELD